MRILLVNDYYPPRKVGGAEIAVAALAGALVQAGHAVTVLTGSDGQSQHGEQVISTGLEAHWGSPTDPKRGVARRAQRHALHRLVEQLQGVAPAGVRARRHRALARAHAVEPQPAERGESEKRDEVPHRGLPSFPRRRESRLVEERPQR